MTLYCVLKGYFGSTAIKYFQLVAWSCADHYNGSGIKNLEKAEFFQKSKDLIEYTMSIRFTNQTA